MALRFRLSNGLTVVLEESHVAPVAAFQLWVKVGSADENPEEVGLAHLHEHMLFKGTARRGPGAIARSVEAHGGEINAWTSFDQTVYHVVMARRHARAGLDVLVIEKAGLGGQAGMTERLDNFPGFPDGISGAEFADRLARQAGRFNADMLKAENVTGLRREHRGSVRQVCIEQAIHLAMRVDVGDDRGKSPGDDQGREQQPQQSATDRDLSCHGCVRRRVASDNRRRGWYG